MAVMSKFRVGLALSALVAPPFTAADDGADGDWNNRSLDDIGLELSSPVNSLFSLGNDLEFRTFQGSLPEADDQSAYTYVFRPSIAFARGNGRKLMLRFEVPMHGDQPVWFQDEDNVWPEFRIRQQASTLPTDAYFDTGHDHLGDIGWDLAWGGVDDSGLLTMYGVAGAFPTSQDLSNSRDHWLLGPEVALGKHTDWGLYGAWFKHLTNVGGESRWDTNMTSIEVFFAHGLGNGWQVIANPVIEYDWEGDADNKLFLPLGGGMAKTMRWGRVPVRMSLELHYYLESPDALGPDWLATINLTPVLRNPFAGD